VRAVTSPSCRGSYEFRVTLITHAAADAVWIVIREPGPRHLPAVDSLARQYGVDFDFASLRQRGRRYPLQTGFNERSGD
jgi:hypothetical protein